MSAPTPRPRLNALTPLLVVSDLQRALDFYLQKLAFAEPSVWGEPPCFAMLKRDGFELMLSSEAEPARARPSGVWDLYLRVGDIAAELAALRAAGVTIDKGPTDTFYEMREIEIVDPDGHRICVAQDVSTGEPKYAHVWEGVLDVGSAKLRLVLKVTVINGKFEATLDSLDQGTMNLPVERVQHDASAVRFEMSAIGAQFAGVMNAEMSEITGEWTQRGRTWPLVWRVVR